jgi:hypothetical protein
MYLILLESQVIRIDCLGTSSTHSDDTLVTLQSKQLLTSSWKVDVRRCFRHQSQGSSHKAVLSTNFSLLKRY